MSQLLRDTLSGYTQSQLLRMSKLVEIRNRRIDFTLDHHRNSKGQPMTFRDCPFLEELYQSLSADIVLQSATQTGKSEWAIIDHLAMAASGVPCMYVLPKYDIKNRFVQMRINRVIQTVPAYKKLAGRGFFDNCTSKLFGKSTIVYAGSNVESDFRETPAGAYYIDEVDHCNQANLRLLDDRIARSNYKFRRWLANPKFAGAGINGKFLESDQRHWHVPCPNCNCHKKLEWFGCVVDSECDSKGNTVNYKLMDDQWKPGCGRDIYALCPDCGNPLDRMSTEGIWVPENEESDITGYRLSRIYSAFENLDSHWRAFQPAIMDPSVMETFCTSHLGIVSSNSGSRVTPDMLKKAAQDFHFVNAGDQSFIPDRRHDGPCSMGIDVGSRFDVRISTRRNGKRQALFIGKVGTMEELKELVQDFNVKCCVMDAMPEIHMVEEFQDWAFNAELDCGIWSCRYRPTEGKESKIHYKSSEMRILCDRTMLMDRSLAQVIRGFNALPSNVDALIGGDYAKEFCAPVRSLQTAPNGTQRFQWRCAHEKIADHQRHADVYDLLAFDLIEDSVVADAVIL